MHSYSVKYTLYIEQFIKMRMSKMGEYSTSSDDDHKIEWKCSFIYNLEIFLLQLNLYLLSFIHYMMMKNVNTKKSSSWNTVTKQKVPEWIKIKKYNTENFSEFRLSCCILYNALFENYILSLLLILAQNIFLYIFIN